MIIVTIMIFLIEYLHNEPVILEPMLSIFLRKFSSYTIGRALFIEVK